jgi:Protein of unknown function (DUF2911)
MREKWRKIGLSAPLLAGILACALPSPSQVASPPAEAACQFSDGKVIRLKYISPRMRGRKIFGGLVPYGEEWRVGANEATSFVTNADLISRLEDAGFDRFSREKLAPGKRALPAPDFPRHRYCANFAKEIMTGREGRGSARKVAP